MGSSGIGKSTLIHMIAGIDQPTSGTISFQNTNIADLALEQRINILQQSIGLVFQQALLLQELSVLENIMLKQIIHSSVSNNDIIKAQQLLQEVGLLDKANSLPSTLSGGQQQRISILRAIFHVPQFLLADEPTGNLDKKTGQQIIHLLLKYKQQYNMGLIISTHDINIAQQCDVVLKIENQSLIKH